jgi:hypothetical protein
MKNHSRAWGFVLALSALGCTTGGAVQRGVPLYPVMGQPRPISRVARLLESLPIGDAPGSGARPFIRAVDDRDVAKLGGLFELLPGCHLVWTADYIAVSNGSVRYAGAVQTRLFPFRMRAGYDYVVVVAMVDHGGAPAPISIYAEERDVRGTPIQKVRPAASDDDIRACLDWQPPSR